MIVRGTKRPTSNIGRGRPLSAAQKAVIEKWHSTYVNLSCGHSSTWEVDRLYSFGRPRKKMSWCEQCSKWSNMIPIGNVIKYYPDEPMF